MSSHEAFLKEIVANPDDLTPRLIYADWLDEQGDP
ncbi:MAG: TIGR02996 domain-containing protein, partial [Planctomycetaceae bacterium]|nr:TIGR02996 domain-containing protein [Planctomycetaceae bacterium]